MHAHTDTPFNDHFPGKSGLVSLFVSNLSVQNRPVILSSCIHQVFFGCCNSLVSSSLLCVVVQCSTQSVLSFCSTCPKSSKPPQSACPTTKLSAPSVLIALHFFDCKATYLFALSNLMYVQL